MTSDWNREWTAAVDALEADVAAVEAMLADDHLLRDHPTTDPWQPPQGLGPLPLDLRARADAILQRQIATTRAITIALAANRRQAAMASRIETGAHGAARPAYLDHAM